MNMKVLASFGVIISVLAAFWLVSAYTNSDAEMNLRATDISDDVLSGTDSGAAIGGTGFEIKTSVEVADQDVSTSVIVEE